MGHKSKLGVAMTGPPGLGQLSVIISGPACLSVNKAFYEDETVCALPPNHARHSWVVILGCPLSHRTPPTSHVGTILSLRLAG